MTPAFRYALLWLLGSAIMIVAALTMLSCAYVDGQYIPAHADAFYHARRVLDSLMTGAPVIQFDPRMHVPEGSWVTWPWGFDTVLVWICRVFGPFATEAQANRVLMNIPPVATPIAVALVVTIARQLALPFVLSAVLVIGFAVMPMAFMQFSVGNIDHHFAELLWTLATLSSGIWFFRAGPVKPAAGIVLGAVLGSALAIHNGLFILQVPVAATFGLLWLRGMPLPDRARVTAFSVTLLIFALIACVPSQPWRRGVFEFSTLSWFHFYICACVAVFGWALSRVPMSRRNAAIVSIAAVAALLPIAGSLAFAGQFISGKFEAILAITEAKSPYLLYAETGESASTRLMTWMMWLLGPMALLNLWWVYRLRDTALQFVAVLGAFGLVLMQSQYRLGVYGEISMLLTPLLATHMLCEWRPAARPALLCACVVLFAGAFYPTHRNWTRDWLPGGGVTYAHVRSTFPVLHDLCEQRPGIVLGDLDTGHWVLYHSKCSVIANVFLLTPQHAAKARESGLLFEKTPAELLADPHPVRYVFAHHAVQMTLAADGSELPRLEQYRPYMQPLEADLLGPLERIPPQFKLRWEVHTRAGQLYARLFEIERGS